MLYKITNNLIAVDPKLYLTPQPYLSTRNNNPVQYHAGHAGILLLMKGKLTIGKVKSSRLDTHDGPTHRDLQQVAK